jgi:metallophosphoesterase (TIGR03767 family)
VRRLDLARDDTAPAHRESLLNFAYFTDLHILDPESPGRYEFVERLHGPEALHLLLPAYRPQEFLQLHAVDAMIRTMNSIADSPVTGAPVQFLLSTGDQTDNAQLNELQQVIRLMEGGTVTLAEPVMEGEAPGGLAYEGVASDGWEDSNYWHPSDYADDYKLRFGFPIYPGLLEEACRPFQAQGIKLPWLACHGNHDGLVLGTAHSNPAYERIVTGSEKARSLPPGFDPVQHVDLFISYPEAFLAGPTTTVRADSSRRTHSRHEFVQAFVRASGEPRSHGFTSQNLFEGTAYYVDDRYPRVRIIVLDTVNMCGHYQGSIGAAQFAWLEHQLAEVHSRYWDARGILVESGNEDRLVVVCSHHGLSTLINDLAVPGEHHEVVTDLPRVLGPEIESLLHRFPNVILWVNGHTHCDAVRPRLDPPGRHPGRPSGHPQGTRGFWEVTTSSLIDWPCQARMVEIVSNGDGTLSVFCTMVDHTAPPDPQAADGLLRLASIHRELAANDLHAGIASGRQGELSDRNVELVMAAPFPLE